MVRTWELSTHFIHLSKYILAFRVGCNYTCWEASLPVRDQVAPEHRPCFWGVILTSGKPVMYNLGGLWRRSSSDCIPTQKVSFSILQAIWRWIFRLVYLFWITFELGAPCLWLSSLFFQLLGVFTALNFALSTGSLNKPLFVPTLFSFPTE